MNAIINTLWVIWDEFPENTNATILLCTFAITAITLATGFVCSVILHIAIDGWLVICYGIALAIVYGIIVIVYEY